MARSEKSDDDALGSTESFLNDAVKGLLISDCNDLRSNSCSLSRAETILRLKKYEDQIRLLLSSVEPSADIEVRFWREFGAKVALTRAGLLWLENRLEDASDEIKDARHILGDTKSLEVLACIDYQEAELIAGKGDLDASIRLYAASIEGWKQSTLWKAGSPDRYLVDFIASLSAQTQSKMTNLKVFISYCRSDSGPLALWIKEVLQAAGAKPWIDVSRIHGGARWQREIEHAIDDCDIALAILTKGSYRSEICRCEQMRSLRKGKRLIPLRAQSDAELPLQIEGMHCRDWTDALQKEEQLIELLTDLVAPKRGSRRDSISLVVGARYTTAPPRVTNYIDRPKLTQRLRDMIFQEDSRQPISLTAMSGMGGVGKTVLAQALTRDEAIIDAFPDGIIWITAGRDRTRNSMEQMHELARAFGDDLTNWDTESASINRYKTLIKSRAVLVVVDDVWSKGDLDWLLAESPRSRFLFTTRDSSIGRFVGARKFEVELFDEEHALQLLADWTSCSYDSLPKLAQDLVKECGLLPMTLAIVGAILRDSSPSEWHDVLKLMRKSDLTTIDSLLAPGQRSFFQSVDMSVERLPRDLVEYYVALAVLLEDMKATLPTLRSLWNTTDEGARRIGRILSDKSLVLREMNGEIRLHDLQTDYVRAKYPDQTSLKIIHTAMESSSAALAAARDQFSSQLVGRLLSRCESPTIKTFVNRLIQGTPRPWLRPLFPSLGLMRSEQVRKEIDHGASITSVCVGLSGKRALSTSADGMIKAWSPANGEVVFTTHEEPLREVTSSVGAKGRDAVFLGADGDLRVIDMESLSQPLILHGHSDKLMMAALDGDGRLAVGASAGVLTVWDLRSNCRIQTLAGHKDDITGISIRSGVVFSGSSDGELRVWNMDSTKSRHVMYQSGWVRCVAIDPEGQRGLSVSTLGGLMCWDLISGRLRWSIDEGASTTNSIAFSADGSRAILLGAAVSVWDMVSQRYICTYVPDANPTVCCLVNDSQLIVGDMSGTLTLLSLEIGGDR